jgi:ligand-binding SRPBCC domain-containing protein
MVALREHTVIAAPIERCFDLARSVEVHLEGNVHWGETAIASGTGLIELGQQVTWRAKHFGLWLSLTSEITSMHRPSYFQDAMTHGPFRFLKHDHIFQPLSQDTTEMEDVFTFAAPLSLAGRLVEICLLRRYMQALLRERNAVLKHIAESEAWRRYLTA